MVLVKGIEMTIKQVLVARGIYSVELELELLRSMAGEQQEYYQPIEYPNYHGPSETVGPPWFPPFEITCTSHETCTAEYS